MILSKYEFQSQQALCLMEGGGGGSVPPTLPPDPPLNSYLSSTQGVNTTQFCRYPGTSAQAPSMGSP